MYNDASHHVTVFMHLWRPRLQPPATAHQSIAGIRLETPNDYQSTPRQWVWTASGMANRGSFIVGAKWLPYIGAHWYCLLPMLWRIGRPEFDCFYDASQFWSYAGCERHVWQNDDSCNTHRRPWSVWKLGDWTWAAGSCRGGTPTTRKGETQSQIRASSTFRGASSQAQ